MSSPKLSMNQMTTYRWSLADDVQGCRDAGFGGIGICRSKLVEFGEERGIDLVRESGLSVSTLSWAGGFTGSNGQTFAEAVDDGLEAVRLAGELGAASVVVVSGSRAGHTINHARRLLRDALRRLGDAAAARGLTLGRLPMHAELFSECTFLHSIEQTLEAIDACEHPAVRMTFDVYHLWQEPLLSLHISQMAPRVAAVKISDWREPPRSENDRCLPGDGEIPLRDILQQFLHAGFDGWFEIDIWSEELWGGDYDQLLRQCSTRCRQLFL